MLTDPFPNPDTNMVAMETNPSSQVLMLSIAKPSTDILVSMSNKYYGSQAIDQPTTSNMNLSTETIPSTAILELTIKPPKGVIHKSTYNP